MEAIELTVYPSRVVRTLLAVFRRISTTSRRIGAGAETLMSEHSSEARFFLPLTSSRRQ